MENQLTLTSLEYNYEELLRIYYDLDGMWHNIPQLCVTRREGVQENELTDGTGSIWQYAQHDHTINEFSWDTLHPMFESTYLEFVINDLKNQFKVGRVRFMRMNKDNMALTYHYDDGLRLHIPLKTTNESWFILDNEQLCRMHHLGMAYILDASRKHSALNLARSGEDRIHLVACVEPL